MDPSTTTQSDHDDLRQLRDEVRHLARRAAAENLEELQEAVRRDRSPGVLVGTSSPYPVATGPDGLFVRSVIGAFVLTALAWGGAQAWRSVPAVALPAPAPTTQVTLKPERYEVLKPVVDTVLRDETYTVRRPVTETVLEDQTFTVQKPVTRTVIEKQPYTVRRAIHEIDYEDRIVTVKRPRSVTVMRPERVAVEVLEDAWYFDGWGWVNAPRYVTVYETRMTPHRETRMVDQRVVRKTPVEKVRHVEEQRYREVPVEQTEYVAVEETRQVPVERTRYEVEQRTRQIPERVVRYEREQRVRLAQATAPETECPAPALPAES